MKKPRVDAVSDGQPPTIYLETLSLPSRDGSLNRTRRVVETHAPERPPARLKSAMSQLVSGLRAALKTTSWASGCIRNTLLSPSI